MSTRHKPAWVALAAIIAASMFAVVARAQLGSSADARVRKVIEAIGWKYEVDSDGDYKMVFRFDDERTQLVYANGKTVELGNMEIREVWAPGFKIPGDASAEMLLDLLRENNRVKVGAWRVIKSGSDLVAVFTAQISADADKDTFQTVVQAVCTTADEKEKAVTEGGDDF
ncbi:YbjN domain-containing protein [Thermopirellula anaerolimosa]